MSSLIETDRKLCEIKTKLMQRPITPINLAEAKNNGKNGKEPIFQYEVNREYYNQLWHELKEISTDGTCDMEEIYKSLKEELEADILMTKSIGTSDFTKYSIQRFGKPSESLIKKAYHILQTVEDDKEEEPLSIQEAKDILKDKLSQLNLDWKINEKEMTAKAEVLLSNKTLNLKNTKFSESFVKRLIVHEIGTHIFRGENGAQQELKIFEAGFPNNLMTEEGLAAVNEKHFGVMKNSTLRQYAARVVAIETALQYGFKDVYKHLTQYLSEEDALTLTIRVKKGLDDTSQPGAYTKDYLYLKGYLELLETEDINLLYYGRIGIEHMQYVKKGKLNEPRFTRENIRRLI